MKIAVIAANGRTGKLFVERALAAGHQVRAGVYRTNNLTPHDRLEVVTCDATNETDVVRLLTGQDAVVSFIGHVKGSPAWVQTDAMRTVLGAMAKTGVRRIVSLTGTGVRVPGDEITLMDRVLNLSISIIDPARVADGREHVRVLRQSDMDWTVIRVLKLQNTRPRPFTLREHGPTKLYVSREEVAESVLQVLADASFITRAPIISR